MNYLAHLLFAQPNSDSRIGNLLGDFYHGTKLELLNPAVAAGLYNHRAVDWFTDHHAEVRAARLLFSPDMRRFAPIALDMLFDFCLIKYWNHFFTADFSRSGRKNQEISGPYQWRRFCAFYKLFSYEYCL